MPNFRFAQVTFKYVSMFEIYHLKKSWTVIMPGLTKGLKLLVHIYFPNCSAPMKHQKLKAMWNNQKEDRLYQFLQQLVLIFSNIGQWFASCVTCSHVRQMMPDS